MLNEHLSPFYQKLNRHHLSKIELKNSSVNEKNMLNEHLSPLLPKMEQAI